MSLHVLVAQSSHCRAAFHRVTVSVDSSVLLLLLSKRCSLGSGPTKGRNNVEQVLLSESPDPTHLRAKIEWPGCVGYRIGRIWVRGDEDMTRKVDTSSRSYRSLRWPLSYCSPCITENVCSSVWLPIRWWRRLRSYSLLNPHPWAKAEAGAQWALGKCPLDWLGLRQFRRAFVARSWGSLLKGNGSHRRFWIMKRS